MFISVNIPAIKANSYLEGVDEAIRFLSELARPDDKDLQAIIEALKDHRRELLKKLKAELNDKQGK